jgi:hypothetical protein
MNAFTPSHYGPAFAPLLTTDRRRPLDAGQPATALRKQLQQLTIENAFAHLGPTARGHRRVDPQMAACCLSAVWLLHDFVDEAHTICQDIPSTSGSYWHAILHRREGDFANAKYWFRRVGEHEALAPLSARTAELAAARGQSRPLEKLIHNGTFDPCAFVDLVEKTVHDGRPEIIELCLDIQQAEWETLFDWCYQRATSS